MRITAILLALPTAVAMFLAVSMALSVTDKRFPQQAGPGTTACVMVYFAVVVVISTSLLLLALRPKERFLLYVPAIGLAPLWAVWALMSTPLAAPPGNTDVCLGLLFLNAVMTVFYLGAS